MKLPPPCRILRKNEEEWDIYCPPEACEYFSPLPREERGPYRKAFYQYQHHHLLTLDCLTSPHAYTLWGIPFTREAQAFFITPHDELDEEERILERVLRYLAEQKQDEKYHAFIREYWHILEGRGGLNAYTQYPVLRRTPRDPALLLSRNPLKLSPYLTFRAWLGSMRRFFQRFFRRCCHGRHIAIIGPDGSGKTTLIRILTRDFGWPSTYGGYRDFSSSRIPLVSFIRMYAYDWYRWLRMLPVWLRGQAILWDRHPRFEHALLKGWKGFLTRLAYTLYPKPHVTIILFPEERLIAKRKPEEYDPQRYAAFKAWVERMAKRRNIFIVNAAGLDETLNDILKIIFTGWSAW